jgi:hypothetical protein
MNEKPMENVIKTIYYYPVIPELVEKQILHDYDYTEYKVVWRVYHVQVIGQGEREIHYK